MAVKQTATRSPEFFESIIDTVREPLIILDQDLRVVTASRSFYDFFKVKPDETEGQLIYNLGNDQWDIPKLRELLETILPAKTTFDNYEVEHDFATIGKRVMLLNARQIKRALGKERIILLAIEDITERKQLESLLIDSEKQYRRLFEMAKDGIVFFEEREGKITQTNPASEKMLGYTKKELIGNKLQDIGIILDMGDFQTTMQNLDKSGIINYRNVKVETKSGQHIDTEIYLVDRAKLVQCNIRNVTEHKKTEKALWESEEKHRWMLDHIADVIAVMDMNLRFTYVSPSIMRMRGYTVEEATAQTMEQVMTPESLQNVAKVLEEEMKLEASGTADPARTRILELEQYRKDGSIVCMDNSLSFMRDAAQKPVGIISVSRDITERKRAEEKLLESERRHREFFTTSRDCVFITSKEGKWIDFNDAALELFGYDSREELSQVHLSSLYVNLEERSMLMALIENQGYVKEHPAQLRRRDGRVIDVLITSGFRQNTDGFEKEYFGTIRDITAHKKAVDALKESEKKYRLLADNIHDVIFVLDMNLKYTYVSPSVKTLRGYDPEEVMKQLPSEILTPSSLDLAMNSLAESLEMEKTEHREINRYQTLQLEMMRKDGATVLTEVKFSAIRNENQQPVGILGVTRDITERKRADEKLKESEKKYRLLADNVDDVIFVLDLNLNYTYGSPSVKILMGYEQEELLNLRPSETMTPSSWDLATKNLSEELEKYEQGEISKLQMFQLEMIRKDGSTVWTEVKVSFIRDENRRPVGIIGVTRDITERKRAVEAIRESEEKYRTILKDMDDVYFEVDIKGIITFVNYSSCKMSGYSEEELLRMPFKNISAPDDIEKVRQYFGEIFLTGKTGKPFLWKLVKKNGEQGFFEIVVSLISDKQGKPIGFRGIGRDVTERKRAEVKLQHTLDSLNNAVGVTIQVMVSAVEMRDPYTAGHQLRVANIACAIATEMGFPQDKIDGISMAGSIHDIGKLSIPAEILSKPTKLTNIEFSLIKEHSQTGYEMLKNVESPWPLAQIVYQHHERMDGSGYPRKLKGDEILMEARIMAVSDVVEAMASHRPYRPGLGIDVALAEIEKNKGTHYDNTVADACLRLFREKGFKIAVS